MKKTTKIICLLLALLIILSVAYPVTVHADDKSSESKTVKVGYVISPGFQEGGEGEYKTGQGYEYLQKIASYTGWTYEYVYGDFNDLFNMLTKGEIDLMGHLPYTDGMARLISYGSYEQGLDVFCLYVNESNSSIKADDYSTLLGKKIGVSVGTYQEQLWKDWCRDNDIHCDVIEYSSTELRQDALNSGMIDATIGNRLLTRTDATENWRSLFSFGDTPFYFGVSRTRPDLLEDLNHAQSKILNENPYYNDELSTRYLPDGILMLSQLSDDEKTWLIHHDQPLKVGCLNNYLPISNKNSNGNIEGVLTDVLSAIQENYQENNLEFEQVSYDDYTQMIDDLKNGIIDVATPVYGDYWNADQKGISLTNSFMSTTMLLLQTGGHSAATVQTLGINKYDPLQTVYANIYYPDCEHVFFDSMADVAKALKEEEIDAALSTASGYHVDAILNRDISELSRSTMPYSVNISMAVSKQNPELMSLMNRGISTVGSIFINNSMALHSNVQKKITLTDFVSENPSVTIAVSSVIILFLLVIILRLKNANHRASTDAMTGLLNKVSMREQIKNELPKGGVLFMIDLDNFKTINDSFGHEIGDRVIRHFSSALQAIFRSNDLISRFGGDEFLVFLPGDSISEDVVNRKIDQMQNAIEKCDVFDEQKSDFSPSVSVGVLFVDPKANISYTEAFEKADAALYAAKQKGKRSYVIAS